MGQDSYQYLNNLTGMGQDSYQYLKNFTDSYQYLKKFTGNNLLMRGRRWTRSGQDLCRPVGSSLPPRWLAFGPGSRWE